MADPILQRVLALHPEQFENLIFHLVQARGLSNAVWRRPGADGGRDIEGITVQSDLSGNTDFKRWYIECKRYNSTLDWPTVRGKLAYAESNDADYLLVATTANPTSQCENEIAKWNKTRRAPQIRFWRGYDIANLVRAVPHIATMYGLIDDQAVASAGLIPLAQVVTRLAQSTYASLYFQGSGIAIETVAAVAELFSVRLHDVKEYGHPVPIPFVSAKKLFDWLSVEAHLSGWEDTSLRAILSFLRHEFRASRAIIYFT